MNYFRISRVLIVLIFLIGMPLAVTHAGSVHQGEIAQATTPPGSSSLGGNTNGNSLGGNTNGTPLGGNPNGTSLGGNTAPAPSGLTNPLNTSDLATLLHEILTYVVQIGGIFLTIMLVFVGFQFVAARGNDEKLRSARTALVWTVIGGIILLGANALASDIVSTVQGL